jgi:hypothetical protein
MENLFDLTCPACGETEKLFIEIFEDGATVHIPFGAGSEEDFDEDATSDVFRRLAWDTPFRCGACNHFGPGHSFEGRIAEWMRALKFVAGLIAEVKSPAA